jgi:hypothetical protein
VLMNLVWPGGPEAVRYGMAGALVLATLAAFRRGWRDDGEFFRLATYWAIVTSLLVPFQTGTTNQSMLLIPLCTWLRRELKRWGRWRVLTGVTVLLIALWVLFVGTIKGNWENPVMFLPLPLFSLAILVLEEAHHR